MTFDFSVNPLAFCVDDRCRIAKWTTTKISALHKVCERIKVVFDLLLTRAIRFQDVLMPPQRAGVCLAQPLNAEVLLALEILIEPRFRYFSGLNDFVDTHSSVAPLLK